MQFSKTSYPVVFNSTGGRTSVSLKISDIILEEDLSIKVDRFCLSNCAEILLPAAKNVYFENAPLIGFYGSMLSYEGFTKLHAKKNANLCNWVYARRQEELLERKNLSKGFWKEQMLRLKPNISFEYKPDSCPWRVYKFENQIWLPTGEQLEEIWGLDFTGSVCADDLNSCSKRVNKRWRKGTRIVIGDTLHVSKGRYIFPLL